MSIRALIFCGAVAGLVEAAVRLPLQATSGVAAARDLLPLVWVAPTLYGLLLGTVAALIALLARRREPSMSNHIGDLLPQLAVTVIVLGIAATALGKWHDQRVMAAIPQPTREEPHVLLLLVDGLQAADFSVGSNDAHSPKHLARLAAEGRLLPRIMSDHATLSESLPALMSGNARSTDPIDPIWTVELRERGYARGAIVSHDARDDWLAERYRIDSFDGRFFNAADCVGQTWFCGVLPRYLSRIAGLGNLEFPRSAADLNHALIDWLDDLGDHPGLAFVRYSDSRDFDDQLGKLLDSLRMYELEDQTMIVVVGSNGESLPTLIWYPEHVTSTSTMGIEPDDLRNIDQIGPTILHLVNRSAGQETAAP